MLRKIDIGNMPRNDLLIDLVKSASQGDQRGLKATVETIAAEERSKNHAIMADRLVQAMRSGFNDAARAPSVWDKAQRIPDPDLFFEIIPERTLDELFLPTSVRKITDELIEEHHRRDLLRSHGLEPRHKILLAGAPGNGKTTYAEALAERLMVPLFVVRYENLITSYLGETSGKLQELFDKVRQTRCVLFFDEFDVLGKERGDSHETGEIKRVVSTLLLQIDRLPSQIVTITATNHPELLDRAVWRRFDLRLELPLPTAAQKTEYIKAFFERRGHKPPKAVTIVPNLGEVSYAETEQFCLDILRKYILNYEQKSIDMLAQDAIVSWQEKFTLK